MSHRRKTDLKAHMKWKGAGACALILVAVAAAAVAVAMRYDPGGGQPVPGAPTARANVPNLNMSLAPAQPPQLSSAAGALSDIQSLAARCQTAMIKDVCGIIPAPNRAAMNATQSGFLLRALGKLMQRCSTGCAKLATKCAARWKLNVWQIGQAQAAKLPGPCTPPINKVHAAVCQEVLHSALR